MAQDAIVGQGLSLSKIHYRTQT